MISPDHKFPHIHLGQTMYTYKDFETQKVRKTHGPFSNWSRGGPLGAWYAVFQLKTTSLMVPEYCLTPETRQMLPPKPTFLRAGTAIVRAEYPDVIVYEADCFTSEAEAAHAVSLLNEHPDADWTQLAKLMGIDPQNPTSGQDKYLVLVRNTITGGRYYAAEDGYLAGRRRHAVIYDQSQAEQKAAQINQEFGPRLTAKLLPASPKPPSAKEL